eukprot:CAMPEP_0194266560 /NCGR_PEP_ID=MMETSP0169-20130528/1425_1 /TAXON_ID=218684 /ORGANISM="Corethron pennatum, Strain L29A3" /LENGTH=178 /DNA_ID=CAMNT_0039007269 /DNA_START=44 /DNA_END=577 /DNA_ORIENTATION=+
MSGSGGRTSGNSNNTVILAALAAAVASSIATLLITGRRRDHVEISSSKDNVDETAPLAKITSTSKEDGSSIVMVTGGSGLVGKAIENFVNENSRENESWVYLSSKDGDLRDRKSTEAIFERVKPTHVIHLAAKVGGLFANMSQKVEFYRENVLINDNVMECCRIYKVKKLVSFLSTCI